MLRYTNVRTRKLLYYTFSVQLYYIHKHSFIVFGQHTKQLIQKLTT